jgi:hypothetical protein
MLGVNMKNPEEATPQIIAPLVPANHKNLVEKLLKKIQYKKPTSQYHGSDVYDFGTNPRYIVLARNNEVIYFVVVSPINIGRIKTSRQVLVWRDPDTGSNVGFANKVFFEHLLPTYGLIVSDTQQSPDGKRFWLWSIDQALKSGLHAYYLDSSVRSPRLVPILDVSDLDPHSNIWGTNSINKKRLLLISEKSLFANPSQHQ